MANKNHPAESTPSAGPFIVRDWVGDELTIEPNAMNRVSIDATANGGSPELTADQAEELAAALLECARFIRGRNS